MTETPPPPRKKRRFLLLFEQMKGDKISFIIKKFIFMTSNIFGIFWKDCTKIGNIYPTFVCTTGKKLARVFDWYFNVAPFTKGSTFMNLHHNMAISLFCEIVFYSKHLMIISVVQWSKAMFESAGNFFEKILK